MTEFVPPILEISDAFADPVQPAEFPKTILRYRNQAAAEKVGLADLSEPDWIKFFGQLVSLPDNLHTPLALRYHGHQFGVYNPDLGDGRGFLFAQFRALDGKLVELGTKGSGQTPWSRQGDGRLTLKGGVREILASLYLRALGVKTSSAFSLIETGEALTRSDEPSPARSCVLVRLSETHIRFGSFQRVMAMDERENLARLITHSVTHYHREARDPDMTRQSAALLECIARETGKMIGQWMASGFVHGVMNTDNFNITGETFDFGPYRFLPQSDPNFVAAYFDQQGLYRFGRQPVQGLWALQQLAAALSPLADASDLAEALNVYEPAYQASFAAHSCALLGLESTHLDEDLEFCGLFYAWLTKSQAVWPQVFFDWFGGPASERRADQSPLKNLYNAAEFAPVRQALLARTPDRPERLGAEYFQAGSPTRLLIDDIEALWQPIAEADDWSSFEAKLKEIEALRCAMDWPGAPL